MIQVSIQTDALTDAPASLAATLQMSPQPMAYEMIDLSKRFAREAQLEVVGPTPKVTIQPFNQFRQWRVTLLRVDQPS
jgi:hypothetical protein